MYDDDDDETPCVDDNLPEKIGEKFKCRGQIYTYQGTRHEKRGGNEWQCYVFKSEKYELSYPVLKLLNDLCAGTIRRI